MNEPIKDINEWFPKLPDSIRESLTSNPEQTLDKDTYLAIMDARGYGPVISGWTSQPGSQSSHLSPDEQDWIETHGNK